MDHGTTAHGKSKRLLRGKERMAETLEEERMNGLPIPVFYDFLALFEKSRPNPEPASVLPHGPSTPVTHNFLSRLEELNPNPEPAPVLDQEVDYLQKLDNQLKQAKKKTPGLQKKVRKVKVDWDIRNLQRNQFLHDFPKDRINTMAQGNKYFQGQGRTYFSKKIYDASEETLQNLEGLLLENKELLDKTGVKRENVMKLALGMLYYDDRPPKLSVVVDMAIDAAIESSSRDIYIASPPRGSGYIVNAILYPPSLIGLVLKYTNPPIL
ncbi:hypothetical protein PsorP6_000504 [Peronosclerospora sorghi]|uniref:Uncharacterized protein n=1 Tax=Peronosclerospora sorghi TaxID=230839 RepID=A0ACC0WVY7_9STRA|nr:hypothetical protein PsorP6_000504 [Peronosclerospora sorghi]